MSHKKEVCSAVRRCCRLELGKNIHSIESIHYMLVLRTHERIIFKQLHSVCAHILKALHEIFANTRTLSRMCN